MGITLIVLYVLVMLVIGYWAMKKTHSVGDFFLGGRKIGPWMSAFAYGTTYFSAVLFIGYAGKLGWGFGIHALWIAVGNAIVGTLLAWWVLAARTRSMTARLNVMTMPDFLAVRYGCKSLKIVGALIVFLFLVPYSASVYQGLSFLVGAYTNIPYEYVLGFLAALTGIYIIMGGYFALTVTDLIRGIVELVGVCVMVLFLVHQVGGFGSATSQLITNPDFSPALHPKPLPAGTPVAPGIPIPGWLMLSSLVLLTSFGPWGLPQMVQKFYSIKGKEYIKSTIIVCTIFSLLMAFGAYYTGALTHIFAVDDGRLVDVIKAKDLGIDALMPKFLTWHTPPAIGLVILILVFSASMSSLSSLVLVSASAIAMDLYQGILEPKASKRSVMTLMRVLCGIFVAVSVLIALGKITFIVNLMAMSWGVLAGCFAAPFFYGLFWRGTTKAGAIAGVVGSLIVNLVLCWVLGTPGISASDPAIPVAGAAAIVAPFIIVPIVSLITKPLPKELVRAAFVDEVASK